jgi:26S proteasome regulatory subunit N2
MRLSVEQAEMRTGQSSSEQRCVGSEDPGLEAYRVQLFKLVLRLFMRSPKLDWSSITIVWVQSRAVPQAAEALGKLISAGDIAQAYQIGFDLYEIASQGFITELRHGLFNAGLAPNEDLVSHVLVLYQLY